jgi:hypothetical protein
MLRSEVSPEAIWINSDSDIDCVAQFEQDIINVHCLHIIFCASADNGYARVLGPHRNSNTSKSQITLVEGPPFAREIRELAPAFRTTSFPEVFRSQKLSRRVSLSNTPTTAAATGTGTPTANYASIVRTSNSRSPQNNPPSPSSPPPTPASPNNTKLPIHKNALGQRVDSPLHYSTRGKLEALKQHKFCNQFHILGSCSWGEGCTHKHNRRLVGQDVIDLMCVARLSVCPRGLNCEDEYCTSGHRCLVKGCVGPVGGCKFGGEMHGVDTRIVV